MRSTIVAVIGLALAIGCANLSDTRNRLDIAQNTLTTACNSAFTYIEAGAVPADTALQIAAACAEGGIISLEAQAALDQLEVGGLPADVERAKRDQIRVAIDGIRKSVLRILGHLPASP